MIKVNSIIGFDFGTKNIGIAVGQQITCTAKPLMTCKTCHGVPNWQQIACLLNEWQPKLVVVGLPLNMDGSEQLLTVWARRFANRLHGRFGVKVVLHDERLSTKETRTILFRQGGYRALIKDQVNARAATVILESWLSQFLIK